MNFFKATQELKKGNRITRASWRCDGGIFIKKIKKEIRHNGFKIELPYLCTEREIIAVFVPLELDEKAQDWCMHP